VRDTSHAPKVEDLKYGLVYVERGAHKGRIFYYDDDEQRSAICYSGHPTDFVGYYIIRRNLLRVPTIDDLITRKQQIWRQLNDFALAHTDKMDLRELHSLWSERAMIDSELYERRMFGELARIEGEKSVFLCHCSNDKGVVRMVNDDLRRPGINTWLDENIIRVGDSIVGSITDGLRTSQVMAVFLSPAAVNSIWARRE